MESQSFKTLGTYSMMKLKMILWLKTNSDTISLSKPKTLAPLLLKYLTIIKTALKYIYLNINSPPLKLVSWRIWAPLSLKMLHPKNII